MPPKFSLSLVARKNTRDTDGKDPRKPKVPRVRDLTATPELCPVVPPPEVVAKLGEQNLAVGIDIETADWTERKHALQKGQFGFHTMCGPEVFDQRIIKIGWFVKDLSNPDADTEHGEIIIQPGDFQISAKATKLHGVSNERAQHDGGCLSVTFCGCLCLWLSVVFCGCRLLSVAVCGCLSFLWLPVAFCGSLWLSGAVCDFL